MEVFTRRPTKSDEKFKIAPFKNFKALYKKKPKNLNILQRLQL